MIEKDILSIKEPWLKKVISKTTVHFLLEIQLPPREKERKGMTEGGFIEYDS